MKNLKNFIVHVFRAIIEKSEKEGNNKDDFVQLMLF